MIRYAIAALALVGGLGYTVGGDCRSQGTGDAVGAVLTADEMAFTVGQSCTLTKTKEQDPKPCSSQASNPNSCRQSYTNDEPPKMNCCVTSGGTKGCTAESSYTSDTGAGTEVLSPLKCAKEQTFQCTCETGMFLKGWCTSTAGNAGFCGDKNSKLPGC